MKQLFIIVASLLGSLPAVCQNTATVSGSNIIDLNGAKLANGQICFLGTDQADNPISFQQGGGGQILRRQFCSAINAGVITSFTIPNPANTLPSGIYYRVTVKDTSTGAEVLHYTGVTFNGGTFNFDTYTPPLAGAALAPLAGTSVSGNLGVTGNISATGSVTGSNIPASILQQIFNQGVGLTQRTAFNCLAGIVCSDNAGTARTDVRLGTLTAVTFSATPTFDASTASTFKITLTGNITSSALSNAVAGQPLAFEICQDAVGGHTFVPPANVVGFVTIPSSASACVLETFVYDGANALADSDVAGMLKGAEAAAPAGVASFDLLYADLTAHRWKMINNNGTAVQVVASGADINTSDQVTVTHLASPLSAAQGGTGQNSTATFPASGIVVTGTGTTNKLAKFTAGTSGIVGDSSITDSGAAVSSSEPFTLTTNHQMFTSSGTFIIPGGVTALKVTVIGGGGAGMGGNGTSGSNGAGGGAGGAAIKWLAGLTPGNTLTVTIGSGGTGVSNAPGNNGAASTVTSGTQTISTITANGGGGAPNAVQPGFGGNSSGGDLNLTGSFGTSQAAGGITVGGNGGSSLLCGGGAPGVGGPGGSGVAAGAGGGGAGGLGGVAVPGGNGANGIVIFEWIN